jgi:hypothetical protein
MPHSRPEGKPWLVERITALQPATILDVGVGAGTYWNLLHKKVNAVWTGVEIHAPYVRRYKLDRKYDHLIVGDFLTEFVTPAMAPFDVVILGDVLEHVAREDAQAMWDKARSLGTVFLTLPLDNYVQGPVYGNQHEAHLHHWSALEVETLGGVTDSWIGPRKGCFVADKVQIVTGPM